MQDPQFESLKLLPSSDPLSHHISQLVGIDYATYLQYRQNDKNISFLVGKSIDRNSNPVWGRPAADNQSTDRPPVDRSSGLYNSRRSIVTKETKDVHAPVKKNPTPVASKGTPKEGGTSAAEDVSLKDDLYLTSSDDEESVSHDNTDGKYLKLPQGGESRPASDSSTNSKTKELKDLSYWMCRSTEKLKAPSTSNSDGAATPDDQKSQKSSTHEPTTFCPKKDIEEDPVTPKSVESGTSKYRELVKSGLDSLVGQRPAKRSNLGRMLSGLNDTDDEGASTHVPSTSESKPSKRSKHHRSEPKHHRSTPRSPVASGMEWKQRKSRSPRNAERPVSNCFVDRKVTKSPKRELIPYSDLGDDESDCSPIPSNIAKPSVVQTEPVEEPAKDTTRKKHLDRRVSPSSSPVTVKRRKFDKAAPSENSSSKHTAKSNASPSHRHRSIKGDPKVEASKNEVFDKLLHGFKHPNHLSDLHVSFRVHFPSVAPSHRKRKRRHNENTVKVEETSKESSKADKVPISLCPVQSSSSHSNSDTESLHNRLEETGGFNPSTNANSDPFDVASPETDPMVDPSFDRNLSDVDSDYEVTSQRRKKKSKSPVPTHSSHRHREGGGQPSSQPIERSPSPSKGANSRISTVSVDQHSTDINSESEARRANFSTFEHKPGHTNSDTNLVGHSLSVEYSRKESSCKKSPESRTTARPPSPRGDRTQSVPSKTSPVHDAVPDSNTIKPESNSDLLKSKTFTEPFYKSMPKIPRKRPPISKSDEPSESKKKRKIQQDHSSASEESHPKEREKEKEKEVTKMKEREKDKDRDRDKEGTKEKKNRDRHKIKKQKTNELVEPKRDPPSSPKRAKFEVSVSDACMPERSFSPNPSDNAAPFLPPATVAAFSEMATQCELMPAVERDVTDPGTHTKRMAVAFRIAGGRCNTPIASAETRTQPQTPRSAGDGQSGGSVEPRRSSTASIDEGEGTRNRGSDSAPDHQSNSQRCHQQESNEPLMDAVIRHRNLQEKLIQSENVAYQKMNSTQCFSEAAAKKHEADRLKNEGPSRFALNALRACYLFIQACYVEERQGKLDNAAMHYRETMIYVRSTSHMIEQVTKVPSNSDLLNTPKARMRHNFITLLCAEMKAILNYRIYYLAHRDAARLRPEVERELSRCGAGTGANGASERSTPESLSRSPAASGATGSSGASLHLIGEGHHKLLRYLHHTKSLLAAQEYWQHALQLRSKHGSELKKIEERVFRRARHEFSGPETPVPCFLRYLNTFISLHESGEL